MPTEEEEDNFEVVTEEPNLEFADLMAAALANDGINTEDRLCAARMAAVAAMHQPHYVSRLIEAEPNKIVYDITIELPNAGLLPADTLDSPDKESLSSPHAILERLDHPIP